MTLAELLSIPFVRSAESVLDPSRQAWVRRFAYEELPGCEVVAQSTLDGLAALELTRVGLVLQAVAAGTPPPRPRPPLHARDVASGLRAMGLDLPAALLDLPEEQAGRAPEVGAASRAALRAAGRLSS